MRSCAICISLVLPFLSGCRAPTIPAEPSALEYAVWHDVLAFGADATHPQTVVIWPETLPLDERQLQFQRCLPRHMRDVFDEAPAAMLSVNVPENWLSLPDGRAATLGRDGSSDGAVATVFLRLSRVAFSRFHRDGYVWVERRSCTATGASPHCDEREGKLLRVVRDGDRWTPERQTAARSRSVNDPRPTTISARPCEMRSTVANC